MRPERGSNRRWMSPHVWLAVMLFTIGAASAAQAPSQAHREPVEAAPPEEVAEAPAPEDTPDEELTIEDPENAFRLVRPARYWEAVTVQELEAQAQGGGCAGQQQIPPGFLLGMRNKDAEAEIVVQRLPESFLMRNVDDLENYVEAWGKMVKSRAGGSVDIAESSYGSRDGMMSHRYVFSGVPSSSGSGGGCSLAPRRPAEPLKFLVASFFVREQGGEARLYRIICTATEQAFDDQSEDFERLVASFRYTGTIAEEFFVPDAAEDRLLPVEEAAPSQKPGGKSSGLILAVLIVFFVYYMVRRGSRRKSVGPMLPSG